MRSLRRRLLVSLWIAASLVAVVSASIAYFQVRLRAKQLLDIQLQQIAAVAASQSAVQSNTPRSHDSDIEVAIWEGDGVLKYSSTPLMSSLQLSQAGYTDVVLNAAPYRVYTVIQDGRRIEVAQPLDVRDDQAEAAALAALLPMLVLTPVLGMVIAFVVRALLQPIREVAAAVSQRHTFATESLSSQGLPNEVVPLVEQINRLLARQNEAVQRERHFIVDAAHALRTPLA